MSETKYFDLHTTGIGYLNRARVVDVKRGTPFLAVNVNALHGAADSPEYTRFDCRVCGEAAAHVLLDLKGLIEAKGPDGRPAHRVLAGFKLSDLYAETFVYQKGERQGQTGVALKARLLRIDWVKVDGEPYPLPQTETAQAA
jgi:hypothetical protein